MSKSTLINISNFIGSETVTLLSKILAKIFYSFELMLRIVYYYSLDRMYDAKAKSVIMNGQNEKY